MNDEQCGKLFKQENDLQKHLQRHLNGKIRNNTDHLHLCDVIVDGEECGKTFRTLNGLYGHQRTHGSARKRVKCGYVGNGETCCKIVASEADLKKHMNKVHYWEKPYTYDEETKTFTKDNKYKRENISKGKPYLCDKPVGDGICGATFRGPSLFKIHFRSHTGAKPFVCEFMIDGVKKCGYATAQSSNLVSHTNRHIGLKPFVCDILGCRHAFTHESYLKAHQRRHNGETPFKCSTSVDGEPCGKGFVTNSELRRHTRIFHGDGGAHACDYIDIITGEPCGKRFRINSELMNHMRNHSDEQPYVCEHIVDGKVCGSSFRQSYQLTNHFSKYHKPKYECTELVDGIKCGKTFSDKRTLEEHIYIHTNGRHECTVIVDGVQCGKSYTKESSLAVHMNIHTGEKTFVCDYVVDGKLCGQTFNTKYSRSYHARTHRRRIFNSIFFCQLSRAILKPRKFCKSKEGH